MIFSETDDFPVARNTCRPNSIQTAPLNNLGVLSAYLDSLFWHAITRPQHPASDGSVSVEEWLS